MFSCGSLFTTRDTALGSTPTTAATSRSVTRRERPTRDSDTEASISIDRSALHRPLPKPSPRHSASVFRLLRQHAIILRQLFPMPRLNDSSWYPQFQRASGSVEPERKPSTFLVKDEPLQKGSHALKSRG